MIRICAVVHLMIGLLGLVSTGAYMGLGRKLIHESGC